MQPWIVRTFDLFGEDLEESGIAIRLKSEGCPAQLAEKLVAFLPLACGREVLANTGVSLSPTFTCMGEDGSFSEPQLLSSDPLWRTIRAFVIAQRAAKPEAFSAIAMRSSEFAAATQGALRGSKLSDLVGSDPIFLFVQPTALTDDEVRPWWAFWR